MRGMILIAISLGVVGAQASAMAAGPASTPSGSSQMTTHHEQSSASPAATAAARFGFDLFAHLRMSSDNVFFSPLSVELALAMAGEGAAGETARQMRATLHLSGGPAPDFAALNQQMSPADSAYELIIANALWGDRGTTFEPHYLERVKSGYRAELNQVDFSDPARSSATINSWVSQKTRDLIRELISPQAIEPSMKLILTNAIYFKGRWANAFEDSMTRDEDFTPLQGPKLRTPMMLIFHKYRYAESPLAQMLELPYAGSGLSMLVILPRQPAGLDTIEKELTFDGVVAWLARLGPRLVEVHLPRFRLETQYGLEETLAKMGMSDALNAGRADFSGMDGRRDLYIGLVAHKAFVEVNEKGTTAAAATGVMVTSARIRPASEAPVVFRADHPFVFLIRDSRTGAVLFVGRLARPAA